MLFFEKTRSLNYVNYDFYDIKMKEKQPYKCNMGEGGGGFKKGKNFMTSFMNDSLLIILIYVCLFYRQLNSFMYNMFSSFTPQSGALDVVR